jgi:hypothetical protein
MPQYKSNHKNKKRGIIIATPKHPKLQTQVRIAVQSIQVHKMVSVAQSGLLRDGSVGIATDHGTGTRDFYLLHSVQTGSGAHPASHLMATWGSLPGSRMAGA